MNKNLIASENGKRQIHLLAEILRYGVEWNQNLDPSGSGIEPYKTGGLETTAFIVSCCIVQWFGWTSGVATSDVVVGIGLDEMVKRSKAPSVKELEKKLTKFLSSYV